ncbi:hypothetical protein [Longibacter salinarum]|nr:hypothetical protein [Longibacter salinarum]
MDASDAGAFSDPSGAPDLDDCASARVRLVDALGADEDTADRLRGGDVPYAKRRFRSLEDSKTYVYALGIIMTVMSVVLPTAGLYEFFRRVNNLEPIELIGVIAAACAIAAVHMAIAAYVYIDWRKKRLCYSVLADLPAPPNSTPADTADTAA